MTRCSTPGYLAVARRSSLAALCTLCTHCFSPSGKVPPAETTSLAEETAGLGDSTTTSDTESPSTSIAAASSTSTASTSAATSTAATTGPTCGDGIVDAGEECDDMGTADNDGCSQVCLKEFRRVFVTSDLFTGNLNGVAGADTACQEAADQVGLSGEFRAWLSSAESTPAENFVKSTVPYKDVMNKVVADDWTSLATGNLESSIYLTENGVTATSGSHPCMPEDIVVVWSNTLAGGILRAEDESCTSWTGAGMGAVGRLGALESSWTSACVVPCTTMAPLYCFEQ